MKFGFLMLLAVSFVLMPPAQADLISPRLMCAKIKNTTDFTVNGVIRTEYGETSTGEKRRHESNFRLSPGETQDACSTGPFFPGYQVDFTLKTLIPIFSCRTRLRETILIKSEKKDDGGNRIYAVCNP